MVMRTEPLPTNWAEYRASVIDIIEREAIFKEVLGSLWDGKIPSAQLSLLEGNGVNDLLENGGEGLDLFFSAGVNGGSETLSESFQNLILKSGDLGVSQFATIGEALKHLAENYDVVAENGKIILRVGDRVAATFANEGGVFTRIN